MGIFGDDTVVIHLVDAIFLDNTGLGRLDRRYVRRSVEYVAFIDRPREATAHGDTPELPAA
jgi:hypothetical protein